MNLPRTARVLDAPANYGPARGDGEGHSLAHADADGDDDDRDDRAAWAPDVEAHGEEERRGEEPVERGDPQKPDERERVHCPRAAALECHEREVGETEAASERDLDPPRYQRLAVERRTGPEDSLEHPSTGADEHDDDRIDEEDHAQGARGTVRPRSRAAIHRPD